MYTCQCNLYDVATNTFQTWTSSHGQTWCNKGHIHPHRQPTTSSSSLSSCARVVHTCAGTCSHGPYGGHHTCVRIKNCSKCKRGQRTNTNIVAKTVNGNCYFLHTTGILWIEEDITKDASYRSDGHAVHVMYGKIGKVWGMVPLRQSFRATNFSKASTRCVPWSTHPQVQNVLPQYRMKTWARPPKHDTPQTQRVLSNAQ